VSVAFTDSASTAWVTAKYERCSAIPGMKPRLVISYEARTTNDQFQVQIQYLVGSVFVADQFVGRGLVPSRDISRHGSNLDIEISLDIGDLNRLNGFLTGDSLTLVIEFEGLMRVWHDSEDVARFASSPPRDEWFYQTIGAGRQARDIFQIARSDWVSHVMERAGVGEYVFAELKIPSENLRREWKAAASLLSDATHHFHLGNDPEVFFKARAALEALPGHPKEILSFIGDTEKAKRLDALVRSTVSYLHHGRHVVRSDDEEPGFPVTHQDAEFALFLTKIVLAHLASLPRH
jgi:hypothetical protein